MSTAPTINVLLVDDDLGDALLLRSALRSDATGGFSIRTVDRLDTAVAAVAEEPVDVVLLDLGLPDSVGLATFEAFHEAAPHQAVVILTNLVDDGLAVEAVRRGAQDYVVKGTVDELQLARIIRHATERGRLQADVARLAAHQGVLADLGRLAVEDQALDEQFARAAQLVGDCLDARLAVVVQRRPDGRYVVRSSTGDDELEGELLPPLLASQLPCRGSTPQPLAVDVESLDLPSARDTHPALRSTKNLVVLPLRGIAWSGALALVDVPPVHHTPDTLVFVRAVGSLLEEAMRRARAELDLEERAKEVAALAAVGRILQEQAPAQELLAGVVHAVVRGMQFPHRAVARIRIDDLLAASDEGRAGLAEQLVAPIVVNGELRGELEVGHGTELGFLDDYEQQLVDAVAENVSLWLERNDSLRRIRDSEAQLRSVIEQVPGLMWTVGTDMRVEWHAGRGHEQISLAPNERQGRHILEEFPEDHPIVDAIREALAGRAVIYESQRDGRSFETRVEPRRGDDGEIIGAIGMGIDVTESLAASRELVESRRRLEGLFNHAHDAFLLADDEGRYVDANPAAARLTGYSVDELRRMTVRDLAAPGSTADTANEFSAFRSSGRMSGEWPMLRADGEVIETQFNAVADIVPGVHLSVITDVTERKRAEQAVRRSEERFRRLAENAQDIIYRVDVIASGVEYVSPAVVEFLGCTPQQVYDDPWVALGMLDEQDRDRLLTCVVAARDNPAPFVARLHRPDGRDIWVEERRAYVFDDGGRHVATEGVVRDITARKQLEDELREGLELEQAAAADLRTLNEMKDVFLTAVSHELRTPLTSLKGMSHTLLDQHDRLDDAQRQLLLGRLAANADRLEDLLEDLLDIDRLTRGAALLTARDVDVAEVVGRTLEQASTGGRTITSRLEPVRARVDEAKVERVVENLLVNALRHTDTAVPIWVDVHAESDGVVIRVEDAGPGVPPADRERIFEPFEMGETPAARVGGLGIGLNLVARFVELHGGTVGVDERAGGGASFRVWLPTSPRGRVDRPPAPQDAALQRA